MARIQGKQLTNPIILSGSFSGSFQGAGSITSASFATQALTASFAISASHEIIKEISSSHANIADSASGLFGTPSITVNHITASGNISASGDIIGNNGSFTTSITTPEISGNTEITGDLQVVKITADGRISTTSHITASGNINASGTVVGSNLSGTNTGDQDLSNLVTNAQTASFAITGSDVIFGNITSSGNISASGDIFGVTGSFSKINQVTNITDDGNELTLRSDDLKLKGDTITLKKGDGTDVVTIDTTTIPGPEIGGILKFTGATQFTSAITASNISASGDIVANNLSGTNTGDQDLSNLVTNAQTASFAITGSDVIFGNITSSGNISASGELIGNGLTVGGSSGPIQIMESPFILQLASGSSGGRTAVLRSSNKNLFVNSGGGFDTVQIQNAGLVTTNITASGNISSSAIIQAGTIESNGVSTAKTRVIIDPGTGNGAQLEMSSAGNLVIATDEGGTLTSTTFLSNSITASGNISASGDIIGATFGDSSGNIIFSGNVSGSGTNSSYFGDEYNAHGGDANSGFTLLSLGSKPSIHASGASLVIGNATNSTQTGIHLVGEVTASGNISASGDIIANKVTADVVDTSFETFLNFEAATAFTFIAPFAMTINFTGSSTGSMDVVDFVTASANTETFSIRQNLPITLNIFDKLKVTPSASGLFSFSGSRTI